MSDTGGSATDLEVLAIIPARGGSTGLPGKNLSVVGGRPLVAWAVDAASGARAVSRVVGSTDCPEIAEAIAAAGGEIPVLRPSHLAKADARDSPLFLHMLDELATTGYRPQIVVNVRPTAPLRTSHDIDAAIRVLISSPEARSVKSVSLANEPPYKTWRLTPEGLLRPLFPRWRDDFGGDPDVPRQVLPVVYCSNGAVDAVWVEALRETGMFHPGPVAAYVMDSFRSVDIDDPEDLVVVSGRIERRT